MTAITLHPALLSGCLILASAALPARQALAAPAPESNAQRPGVAAIPDLGGVLTPKGNFLVEPSLEFSHSQVNRFTFLGVEILETFLIGLLEAEDADRDLFSSALTFRWGLTSRFEVEMKVPYIWRDDTLRVTIPQASGEPRVERALDGDGLGDIEVAMHLQLNRTRPGYPVYVANLRYKANNGDGPFDVQRDAEGVETELPTGSGFHGIEPSLTVLLPTDPGVLFANFGYFFHLEDDVDKTIAAPQGSQPQSVGTVDPGDAVRVNFGLGYSINPSTSVTLGYKHDFIQSTDTEINNQTISSSSLDIGSLLIGFAHRITPKLNSTLNVEIGATEDAPDVTLTLRLPYSL